MSTYPSWGSSGNCPMTFETSTPPPEYYSGLDSATRDEIARLVELLARVEALEVAVRALSEARFEKGKDGARCGGRWRIR